MKTYDVVFNSGENNSGPHANIQAAIDYAERSLHGCRYYREAHIIPRDQRLSLCENAEMIIRKAERNGETHLIHTIKNFEKLVKEVRRGMFGASPGQGVGGYGSKIPTDYMIKWNKRTYRVYCMCYSNVGSLYVKMGKKMVFVRDVDLE